MYRFFDLYHEMDFSQIVGLFEERLNEKTVFAALLSKFGWSLKEVSRQTKIPYDTLASLKKRRRSFAKMNVDTVFKLASLFRVRMETMAELRLGKGE